MTKKYYQLLAEEKKAADSGDYETAIKKLKEVTKESRRR